MSSGEGRPLLRSWRALAATDLVYKAIAFAILTPAVGVLLRLLIRRTGNAAVADADIALFFFTTPAGALALLLVGALTIGITALEQASLMTVLLAGSTGRRLRPRDAILRSLSKAVAVLRLTAHLVVRALAIVAPFAAVIGAAYWALLRAHDINFYLTARPPELLAAVAIAAVAGIGLVALVLRKGLDWLLALPLVLFEDVPPRRAFGESARRMLGRRKAALGPLLVWSAAAIVLPILVTWAARLAGRQVAPSISASFGGLLFFVAALALTWGAVSLAVGVLTAALFAAIVVRAYTEGAEAASARLPEEAPEARRLSMRSLAALVVLALVLGTGVAYAVLSGAWASRTVLVLAHRGASLGAPENTLAAFRLAGEQRADYVELDVQESKDGVVLVAHDSDLMKVGRSPLKIWEATADALRQVDIGSFLDARFASERVPTLAEALAACQGKTRVDIELKDYGHDDRLEERVVGIVEAAGMQDHIVTMSLSRPMVESMKRLRPAWTSGLLTAKAIGDLTGVPADFLAVEKAMATRRFVRRAHRAGKPVYVWTVDDPGRMARLIGLGVDGLITNRPDLAREVVDRYAAMSRAERLFVFVMASLGAEPDTTPPPEAQRP